MATDDDRDLRIVAIVPCHEEETSVAKVVTDLRRHLPGADVYVYDNASSDATSERAGEAGALVRAEPERGKGNAVRRAFADLDADVYLLIDGDDTYEAADAAAMVKALGEGPYDHILGVRTEQAPGTAYRRGHAQGNRFFNALMRTAFRGDVSDMLSGCRVMSRRFVKSFPALSRRFEIETELTVHAINARVPSTEMPVAFRDRAPGDQSKLRTYHDGARILRLFLGLLFQERPLLVSSLVGAVLMVLGIGLGTPVVAEFASTGLVPRLPTAVLASALVILAAICLVMGTVLDSLAKTRRELKRLHYLAHPAVRTSPAEASGSPASVPEPGAARAMTAARSRSDRTAGT